jgi:hypothetical protein
MSADLVETRASVFLLVVLEGGVVASLDLERRPACGLDDLACPDLLESEAVEAMGAKCSAGWGSAALADALDSGEPPFFSAFSRLC